MIAATKRESTPVTVIEKSGVQRTKALVAFFRLSVMSPLRGSCIYHTLMEWVRCVQQLEPCSIESVGGDTSGGTASVDLRDGKIYALAEDGSVYALRNPAYADRQSIGRRGAHSKTSGKRL
jgi:hypothetical protein